MIIRLDSIQHITKTNDPARGPTREQFAVVNHFLSRLLDKYLYRSANTQSPTPDTMDKGERLRLKNEMKAALLSFRYLGSDGGLEKERLWLPLDRGKAGSSKEYVPIYEVLGYTAKQMSSAFGKYWKTKFDFGKELGQGLHTWPWLNGIWVTVLSNGDNALSVGVPFEGFLIEYNDPADRKIKGLVQEELKRIAPVATISPKRNQNKQQKVADK